MSVSRIEISKRALLSNVQAFRKLLSPKTKFLSVVKANAYGHGLELVAKVLQSKVDFFGVDNFEEVYLLRGAGIRKPILVLGFVAPKELSKLIKLGVSFAIYREDILEKVVGVASRLGQKAKVHLKIETGTNRQGVVSEDLPKLTKILRIKKRVVLEGVYTHFANIEDTTDPSFAMEQLEKFNRALSVLEKNSLVPKMAHTAATAAALLYPQTHFDMVRIGIGLYGLWPSREVRRVSQTMKLVPALSWRTQVVQIKDVPVNESVGYGRTFRAQRPSKIAILPVGYSDGYDRHLSNKGKVLIRDKFAPVVGRIAMNMMTVDVTGIPGVEVEDEVVLIGRQGSEEVVVDDLANLLGTINYEVVARLNPTIPRVLVE